MKAVAKRIARRLGYELNEIGVIPPDFTSEQTRIFEEVSEFTMTSIERIAALVDATRYISENRIAGDGAVVECGVWRGGSMMAVAKTLVSLADTTRRLFLYDTFDGMPEPTTKDVQFDGTSARQLTDQAAEIGERLCVADEADVLRNLETTGYPMENVILVKGLVEETIPANAPAQIALLRLDTDWYESTYHELRELYPRLADGGVMIVDDYGHWSGARAAVDKYLAGMSGVKPLLNRVDYTARLIIKPWS